MTKNPREATTKLMDAMDEGILSPREVADMALNWLSEADVAEMVRRNDLADYLELEDE